MIRRWTGSQCSWRSSGSVWDRLGAWRTIRAALFWTRCSFRMLQDGMPWYRYRTSCDNKSGCMIQNVGRCTLCVVYHVCVLHPVQWTDQQLQLPSPYRNGMAKITWNTNNRRYWQCHRWTESQRYTALTHSLYRDWYRGKYRRYRYCADTGGIGR